MYDRDIKVIEDYIDEYLYKPETNWPDWEFDTQAYSRWAGEEVLERVIFEALKLPPHITGDEPKEITEIIAEYIDDMDYFYEISNDNRKKLMFFIARDVGTDILSLFERRS